ncbi:MAG TPA: Co2+/Mg2+ efflux protein ApaG [Longimicrobiales bacterium]|nr:Co2+/Mg2+ efflux protein ApaG [Longimicrobiales bacterium]
MNANADIDMRYEKATEGIRVRVRPRFSLAESDPADGTFVFSYHVTLANEGPVAAQLLFRHWRIHDSAVGDSVVDGEGVIGQQPFLAPGASHEYSSYCVLQSPVGFMEGYYTFVRPDGRRFRVDVPRFDLSGPLVLPGGGREPADEDEETGQMH